MSNKMITNAISAVLLLCFSGAAMSDAGPRVVAVDMIDKFSGMEKCCGIVKSEAKISYDNDEWVQVPTGLCNKIACASVKVADKI